MTISIVECPHCHYRFNYEYVPGALNYSMQVGTKRLFKCPNCKELHRFDISNSGSDPSLPTHRVEEERRVGGRKWWWFVGIIIVLAIIGFIIHYLITGSFLNMLKSKICWIQRSAGNLAYMLLFRINVACFDGMPQFEPTAC